MCFRPTWVCRLYVSAHYRVYTHNSMFARGWVRAPTKSNFASNVGFENRVRLHRESITTASWWCAGQRVGLAVKCRCGNPQHITLQNVFTFTLFYRANGYTHMTMCTAQYITCYMLWWRAFSVYLSVCKLTRRLWQETDEPISMSVRFWRAYISGGQEVDSLPSNW